MPLGPITIETGDPIPGTFTFSAVNGTPPYTYGVTFRGLEGSGIVANIGGVDSNEVTFDSTNALGGSYVIELEGTVTDDVGDRDGNAANDVDVYRINVNPPTTPWSGDLSDAALDNTDTMSTSVSRGGTSGGQAPYTLTGEWVGGISPHPTISITVTGNSSLTIETVDTPPGSYSGSVRAVVTDNLGQRIVQEYPFSFTVAGAVYSHDGPLLVDEIFGEEGQSNLVTITPVSGAPAPIQYFGHQFVTSDITSTAIVVSANTVSLTTPASNPNEGVFSNTLRVQARDNTGTVTEILIPVTIRHVTPEVISGNTLEATIIALGASSWWPLNEASGDFLDGGVNSYDLKADGNAANTNKIYQLPGIARGEPRVYGAWSVNGFGYGNPKTETASSQGYNGSSWTAGSGMGTVALLSAVTSTSQWPIWHTFDSVNSEYIGIEVESDGTIHFRMRAGTQYFVTASSVAGACPIGDPVVVYGKMGDGVSVEAQIFVNGVDVTDTVTSGTSSNNYDTFAQLVTGASVAGAAHQQGMLNSSAGSPAGTSTQLTGIVSMPHMFVGTSLSNAQIASIYEAAGYAGLHDDYLEYMLDKVGNAKLYWPGLDSYGSSVSVIPVVTNTNTSGGNPRFQAGVAGAIEDDDSRLGINTFYPKKKWDQTGSDTDAYLRNWGPGSEVPLCETTEPGTSGVIGLTVNVTAQPASTAYVNFASGGTDQIYAWFESGVGSDIQMHFRVQLGGVAQFVASLDSDSDLILNNVILFHWVKRVGENYEFYINGRNVTGSLTITTNVSQANWFDMAGLRGATISAYLMGGLVDYAHQSHEYFYLNDVAWTSADVLEHYNAQQGIYPS